MSTFVVVAAVGAATAAALGVGGFDTPPETVRPPQVSTAQVTRESLTDVVTGDGKLEYGVAAPVTSRATGTLTWLPAVGTVVSRGEALLRADEKPVMLLYETLPMYRPLTIGVKGKDVERGSGIYERSATRGIPSTPISLSQRKKRSSDGRRAWNATRPAQLNLWMSSTRRARCGSPDKPREWARSRRGTCSWPRPPDAASP